MMIRQIADLKRIAGRQEHLPFLLLERLNDRLKKGDMRSVVEINPKRAVFQRDVHEARGLTRSCDNANHFARQGQPVLIVVSFSHIFKQVRIIRRRVQ